MCKLKLLQLSSKTFSDNNDDRGSDTDGIQAFAFENTRRTKMARAALCRRATDGPCAVMQRPSGASPVCCLAGTCSPCRLPLDGPFRRAKNDPFQLRRPGGITFI